ncbi:MAG TPA: M4 family metallopeptidase, partial [Methanomassiliicoccales archaeon]|nr:M4 family metallopeptidase [Methanomassiliicoccales archaeon]
MVSLSSSQKNAITRLELSVSVNKTTGVPRRITGFKPSAPRGIGGLGIRGEFPDEDTAAQFFMDHSEVLSMEAPESQTMLTAAIRDKQGNKCLRNVQRVGKVPVLGAEMLIRYDSSDRLKNYIGNFIPSVPTDLPTVPEVEIKKAMKAVTLHDAEAKPLPGAPSGTVILPIRRGARLAYRIAVSRPIETARMNKLEKVVIGKVPGIWDYFVDATKGEDVLLRLCRCRAGTYVTGRGYGYYSREIDNLSTYRNSSRQFSMSELAGPSRVKVTTYDASGISGDDPAPVAIDQNNVWDSDIQAPLVDCHVNSSTVAEYYAVRHGRNGVDGAGGEMRIWGNCPARQTYYIGPYIMIANRSPEEPQYDEFCALDVIAHEWTHAFVASCVDLPYEDWTGTIDEALADAFSVFVKAFADGRRDHAIESDWLFGRQVWMRTMKAPSIRNMKNPTNEGGVNDRGRPYQGYSTSGPMDSVQNGSQPDHLSLAVWPGDYDGYYDQTDWGGVHINNGILNKATYLISEGGDHHRVRCGEGVGLRVLEDLYYDLVTASLPSFWQDRDKKSAASGGRTTPEELELLRDALLVSVDQVYG